MINGNYFLICYIIQVVILKRSAIEIIPLYLSKDVHPQDNLDSIILESIKNSGQALYDGDILIIAHKVISKIENRIVNLDLVKPSKRSIELARKQQKDPRIVEIILRESNAVVKASKGIIITETKHGFICANGGVDQSNIMDPCRHVLLLPEFPDKSARRIRNRLTKKTRRRIAVIISDTFGRPFREGQTNVAIGVSGIKPIRSYIGQKDIYGKKLRVTEIAIADEIASAAELAMGKSDRVPVVIMRGYKYQHVKKSSTLELIRSKEKDLFR
jgi:coenzyme F420-0:L-glutamate ligase/coenzyme F420-1:gamma-L-glutamate ligase